MSRITDERVMGNILGLMQKIIREEKKPDPGLEMLLPQKTKRFMYVKMQVNVFTCNVRDCKKYGICCSTKP